MAGTQFIDKTWDLMKNDLPRNRTARTEAGRKRLDEYVRMEQWKRMVGTEQRWKPFLRGCGSLACRAGGGADSIGWDDKRGGGYA